MADPGDGQGGFTIVQWATFFGTFIGGALAAFVGVKAKTRRTAGDGVEWFYDGPVAKALETLQSIDRETVEARREQREAADEQTDILRDILNSVTREGPRRRS